jgi:hypothetical protein
VEADYNDLDEPGQSWLIYLEALGPRSRWLKCHRLCASHASIFWVEAASSVSANEFAFGEHRLGHE